MLEERWSEEIRSLFPALALASSLSLTVLLPSLSFIFLCKIGINCMSALRLTDLSLPIPSMANGDIIMVLLSLKYISLEKCMFFPTPAVRIMPVFWAQGVNWKSSPPSVFSASFLGCLKVHTGKLLIYF